MITFTLSIRMALVQELLHPRVSTAAAEGEESWAEPLQPLSLTRLKSQFNTPRQHSLLALALCTALGQTPWAYRRFGLTSASSLPNQAREDPVRKGTHALCSSGLRKTSRTFQ